MWGDINYNASSVCTEYEDNILRWHPQNEPFGAYTPCEEIASPYTLKHLLLGLTLIFIKYYACFLTKKFMVIKNLTKTYGYTL